ncbi:PREDICTED: E3 ubiquitin protein ligase RIE1-like [Ipomoea nil]|uniref:E3 ubiquitin protein ligase RIE1-like n=1 Tax=Ipomoea nil TaxID=35883 RepID=UPI00090187E1|nr:PREDICTED: E3 ubiquitin protein ligase RIE1-like [Ipomoea nil]
MNMNNRGLLTTDSFCNSGAAATSGEDTMMSVVARTQSQSRTQPSPFMVRVAMRISRARWFIFLRRVFHYQNGSTTSDLGSNPFNSLTWMMMECVTLSVQIMFTAYTLAVSKEERPVWPMRIWVSGYAFGCLLSLLLLYCRYWVFYLRQRDESSAVSDIEQQRSLEGSSVQMVEKCRTCVELFFAIWFVMGNVWVFDTRFGSFRRAPKLHVLCISLLAWNAVTYSFPFILFVVLCCCVPMVSSFLGYNMNMGSVERGASNEQLSSLPTWKYKQVCNNPDLENENPECCICLAQYRDKEEMRQLPCSHVFHLNCVDQWLRIISCCPLCKKDLAR